MSRRVARRVLVAMLLVCSGAALAPEATGEIPAAYRPDATTLARGLEHVRYERAGPDIVANVARVRHDAPFRLRAIPAGGRVGAGLERTSSICRRVSCAVAVNGDFWRPGTDLPVGGVVSLGELLRSPSLDHAQVTILRDGRLRAGPLVLRASLVSEDLRPLQIAAVNRAPKPDEVVLFTPAHGPTTGTAKGTVELRLIAKNANKVLRLSETTLVDIAKFGSDHGDMPIPREGAVLSGRGRGASAIRNLLARIRSGDTSKEALVRLASDPGAVDSVGGSPVLVSGGRVLPRPENTAFVRGRHPRTLIGWTKSNDVMLVTIDGRQPGYSEGMTLPEAGHFMKNLGAVEAVNLDGGGSTTFVIGGQVANRPSDRAVRAGDGTRIVHTASGPRVLGNVERPVAIALVLVPEDEATAAAVARKTDALGDLDRVLVDVPVPQSTDVASDPTGALPVIALSTYEDPDRTLRNIAVAVTAAAVLAASVSLGYERGRDAGRRWTRRRRARIARP